MELLNPEQRAVIDGMPLKNVLDVVSDIKSKDCAITVTFFALAMHPAFRTAENVMPDALLDYCLHSIRTRP